MLHKTLGTSCFLEENLNNKNMSLPQVLQGKIETPDIPLKVKKASAIILRRYGYSFPQIEKLIGTPKSTVERQVKGNISDIDPETWEEAGRIVDRFKKVVRDKLEIKIMGKMDHELDTKPLPFGSLAFGLKVIGELTNPRGRTDINVTGSGGNMAVQIIKGNVSYNTNKEENKDK